MLRSDLPEAVPTGYAGGHLPPEVASLLDILSRHGFEAEATTQFAGRTINLIFGGHRCGYFNDTVRRRGGVVGYRFLHWGDAPSNGCPPALVSGLVPTFCSRYGCKSSDFLTHEVRRADAAHTYLIITNPTLALQVLLRDNGIEIDPDLFVIGAERRFVEGTVRDVVMQVHERSVHARQACLSKYGFDCQVCRANLKQRYVGLTGELIHVHHEQPLSTRQGEHEVNPAADLKPVCPNCHAVIHARTPPYSISEVRAMLGILDLDCL